MTLPFYLSHNSVKVTVILRVNRFELLTKQLKKTITFFRHYSVEKFIHPRHLTQLEEMRILNNCIACCNATLGSLWHQKYKMKQIHLIFHSGRKQLLKRDKMKCTSEDQRRQINFKNCRYFNSTRVDFNLCHHPWILGPV